MFGIDIESSRNKTLAVALDNDSMFISCPNVERPLRNQVLFLE